MNRTRHIALLIAALAVPAFADDKPSVIKDVMKAAHKAPKGETELCKKVIGGTATDAEKQQLVACSETRRRRAARCFKRGRRRSQCCTGG